MRKILLFVLFISFAQAGVLRAQSLSVGADTVFAGFISTSGVGEGLNSLMSSSTSDVGYEFRVSYHNLPANWLTLPSVTGLCVYNCFTYTAFNGNWIPDGTVSSTDTRTIKLDVDASSGNITLPKYYVTLQFRPVNNPSAVTQTTFVFSRSTAVKNVVRGEVITNLYPNPARDAVNVIFDESAGVHSVAVYSLLGRPVKVFKVAGNSARVDVADVPSGVYFLRLMNAAGSVLATRRFNHQ